MHHGDSERAVSRSRSVGTAWETAVVRYLQERGWRHAERRALRGANDCGDVAGIPGLVVEAKACRDITLGAWMTELDVEVVNADADIGALWIKRRRYPNPRDAYVVLNGEDFTNLLKAAGY